jgi:Protein of unknown function (DUF1153)
MILQSPTAEPQIELPPADTKRWSPSRKAAVVEAARAGLATRQEICARYMMSDEELVAWELAYDRNGVPGLRTTRLQAYRFTQIPGTRRQLQNGDQPEPQRYR